jgi:hypothetical protein
MLREVAMTFLRHASVEVGHVDTIRPIVERALDRSGEKVLLDLCSGGGGPVIPIADALARSGRPIDVTLTDIYPSAEAREVATEAGVVLHYEPRPVDARAVPPGARGLRTVINAFHHFRPPDAVRILTSAVEGRRAITIIEVARRSPLTALAVLGTPIHVLLTLPRLRPFRLAWLPFTYLLPVIPLSIGWDAFISCLRCYSREELLAMAREADPEQTYDWVVEEPSLLGPLKAIALTGISKQRPG